MKTQILRLGRIARHEYLRLISVGCILLFCYLTVNDVSVPCKWNGLAVYSEG